MRGSVEGIVVKARLFSFYFDFATSECIPTLASLNCGLIHFLNLRFQGLDSLSMTYLHRLDAGL